MVPAKDIAKNISSMVRVSVSLCSQPKPYGMRRTAKGRLRKQRLLQQTPKKLASLHHFCISFSFAISVHYLSVGFSDIAISRMRLGRVPFVVL